MTLPEKEALEVLKPYLGEELAKAIIEFRSVTKKAKLTAYAAKLLVKEYQKTGNPVAAAEMQISMNWSGFRMDWWLNEQRKNQRQSSPRRTSFDAAIDFDARFGDINSAIGISLIARN